MTCNTLILAQPETGTSIDYIIPEGDSANLSFDASDMSGISVNANGGLEISFVDGGTLTIANFQSLVDGGNLLYLADGTMVDPALLQNGLADSLAAQSNNDNQMMIGEPAEGVIREITLEPGQDYIFNFDMSTPEKAYTQDGQFVMKFTNGGQIILTNYEEAMAWNDAPELGMESKICTATNEELIATIQNLVMGGPDSGEVLAEAEEEVEETTIRHSEVEGAEVASTGTESGDDVANIEPAAGEETMEESLDELAELANALADVEPAAGEPSASSSNSGYGYGSTVSAAPFSDAQAIGAINPTQLNYQAPQFVPENILLEEPSVQAAPDYIPQVVFPEEFLDESDVWPLVATGVVVADYGGDAPGHIVPVNIFKAKGSVGSTLTSQGVEVVVSQTSDGYEGFAGGDPVFTFAIDPQTGAYNYTQYKPFDHADPANPQDVITLEFWIKAVDADGDSVTSSLKVFVADDAPIAHSVHNVVDETDIGSAVATGTVDFDLGADDTGHVTPNNDFSADGDMAGGALTHQGVPVTVSLVGDTYVGTAGGTTIFTLQILDNGDYTFTLLDSLDHGNPNDQNEIIDLHFGVDVTDGDGDSVSTTVNIRVKDDVPTIGDSQGNVDETNFDQGPLVYQDTLDTDFGADVSSVQPAGVFEAMAGGSAIALTSGGVPVVVIQTGAGYVGTAGGAIVFSLTINPATGQYVYTQNETLDHPDGSDHNDIVQLLFSVDVVSSDGDTDSGVITIDVADDGLSTVDDWNSAEEDQFITGDVRANDNLSEDGDSHLTQIEFGGTTYNIPNGGSVTITAGFGTLVMNSDGTYSYQATAEDPDGNEIFTYTLMDGDGDTSVSTLDIRVTPDGEPVAVSKEIAADETNLTPGPMVLNGHLDVDFGVDGGGTISSSGSFAASGYLMGGALTHKGIPVDVTPTAQGYVGTAGGTTIFTIEVQDNGDYRFELLETIDHADSTDPNDIITLEFGITLMDGDGDTAPGTITVHVHDDAPVAYDDLGAMVEEDGLISGNVTDNDEMSEDDASTVTNVTFDGTDYAVPAGGSVTIVAEFGTLTMDATGAWTYQATAEDPDGIEMFTYSLTDSEGDTDTAELSIQVTPDDEPNVINARNTVDETDGFDTVSGTVTIDYGADTPGVLMGDGRFTSSGSRAGGVLTHEGTPVVVTFDAGANAYTGVAGAVTVFTLQISTNGDYTFQQLAGLDHADTADANDMILLNFGVTATDSDGDTGTGRIRISVYDDGPVAMDDTTSLTDPATSVSGNVLANDNVGADEPGSVTEVTFGGTTAAVPAGGSATINGAYGTLVMNSDGSYEYTVTVDDVDGVDSFSYAMKDYDGDSDTANLSIQVTAHDDEPIVVNAVETVDETNLNIVEPGTVNVNYGGDGPGTLSGSGLFSSGGSQLGGTLSHNGVAVSVTFNAGTNTYTGAAGGTTVFTLQVNADGTYSYQQFASLDHADASDPDDVITLNFGVTATDADGDTGTGSVIVNVRDDGPVAMDDSVSAAYGVRTSTINLLSNDVPGADNGDVKVTNFTVNGTTYDLTTAPGGVVTVDLGSPRSLEVHDDGTAIFHARGDTWTGWMSYWGEDSIDFTYTMRDSDGDTDVANAEMSAYYFYQTIGYDPLVLDLDGDGVELVGLEAGILFDMDNDVDLEQVGWVARDDALLALDRNGDGVINDQSELFGNTDVYADGFANLASYDSNNDGVIDARDAIWNDLIVWQDVNADGVSDSAEMYTLAQMGIASISLSAADVDYTLAGNWVSHESTFTYEDGTVGQIVDAWFQTQEVEGASEPAVELYAQDGQTDSFLFGAIQESAATIMGFKAAEGDNLDLSALLDGDDQAVAEAINEFVYAREEGGDTVISVDVSGSGDAANAVDVARLEDVGDLDIVEMVNDGNIII
ncbi:MAG: type I secretion C-terminal target domain-containing protein [Rhodospirillales bacterium]|nr:MAG: type I secretion C-terminal target domain-containing protein [Rhodospirillales bacterium]